MAKASGINITRIARTPRSSDETSVSHAITSDPDNPQQHQVVLAQGSKPVSPQGSKPVSPNRPHGRGSVDWLCMSRDMVCATLSNPGNFKCFQIQQKWE